MGANNEESKLMEMNEEHLKQLTKFKRSIPGSSLTNDPESPQSFEKPPEFTIQRTAMEYLYTTLIREETYIPLLQNVKAGVPVVDLSQAILFKGFSEGKWNPDLMLLLIEPLSYMIMALAERAGIDYKIYTGEEEDQKDLGVASKSKEKLKSMFEQNRNPLSALPTEIQNQIQNSDLDGSLLAKPDEEVLNDSLLSEEN